MIETLLDEPVVTVHVPPRLRAFTCGVDETMASGLTVGEVLASLGREYPGIISELLSPDGNVRDAFEIYLGGTLIRELAGLDTPVGFEELVAIVPAQGVFRP